MFSTWLLQSNILAQQDEAANNSLTIGESLAEDVLIDQFLQGNIDANTLLQEDERLPLQHEFAIQQYAAAAVNNNNQFVQEEQQLVQEQPPMSAFAMAPQFTNNKNMSSALFQQLLLQQKQQQVQLQAQFFTTASQSPLQGEQVGKARGIAEPSTNTAAAVAAKKKATAGSRKRKAGADKLEREDKDGKVQKTADIFNKIRCLNCNIEWERAAYRTFEMTTVLPNEPKYKFSAKKRQCERCAKKLQQIRYVCKFCNSEFAHDAKTKHSIECIETHTLAPSSLLVVPSSSASSALSSPDNQQQVLQQQSQQPVHTSPLQMQQILLQALQQQQQAPQHHSPVPTHCGITLGSIQNLNGGTLAQVTAHQQVRLCGQFNTCDKFMQNSSWVCYIRHQMAASIVSVNMIQDANGFYQITIPYFPQDGNLEVKTVCHMCKSQSNSIQIYYAMPHDIIEMLSELEDDITGKISDDLATQVDAQNRNVLHYACSYQRGDVLNLVSQRVSPHVIIELMNQKDATGNTPWQMATMFIPFHAQAAWQAKVKAFINKATMDALAIEDAEDDDEDDEDGEDAENESVKMDSDAHETCAAAAVAPPAATLAPQATNNNGNNSNNNGSSSMEIVPARRQLQRPVDLQAAAAAATPAVPQPKTQSIFDNSGIFDSVIMYDDNVEYQKFHAPHCNSEAKAQLHAPNTLHFFNDDIAFVMHKPDLSVTVHTVEAHDQLLKFELKSNNSTESVIMAPVDQAKYDEWKQCLAKVATRFVKMEK